MEPLALVTLLRTTAGLNIFVSPQAQVTLEDSGRTVSWERIEAGTTADALDRLCAECGLRWEIGDGLVTLRLLSESRLPLRFYDINDLVWPVHPFVGTPPGPHVVADTERTEDPLDSGALLAAAIRAAVDPPAWEHPEATVAARRGVLIVRAPASTHASVTEFLASVRREVARGAAR